MKDKIRCQECEEVLEKGKDHHCKKPKGESYTIGFRVVDRMYQYIEDGKCPHCMGTGKIRIGHLKNNPKGRGVVHSHVEEYTCQTCEGSGNWLEQEADE